MSVNIYFIAIEGDEQPTIPDLRGRAWCWGTQLLPSARVNEVQLEGQLERLQSTMRDEGLLGDTSVPEKIPRVSIKYYCRDKIKRITKWEYYTDDE